MEIVVATILQTQHQAANQSGRSDNKSGLMTTVEAHLREVWVLAWRMLGLIQGSGGTGQSQVPTVAHQSKLQIAKDMRSPKEPRSELLPLFILLGSLDLSIRQVHRKVSLEQ